MTVLFFLLEKKALGGTETVCRTLAEELEKEGHQVRYLYLRATLPLAENEAALRHAPWRFTEGREILRRKNPLLLLRRLKETLLYRTDLARARRLLQREKPDRLFFLHFALLSACPRALQSRAFFYVHAALSTLLSRRAPRRAFKRCRGKIPLLLLSEGAQRTAQAHGFAPSFVLKNPLPQLPAARVAAEQNHTVVILSRFSPEKRLPETVALLKRAMAHIPFSVCLYGEGEEQEAILAAVGQHPAFQVAPAPAAPWQNARLTLSLSRSEGYPMTLLEAQAHGIPCLTLPFGEAAEELTHHGKTGRVAENEAAQQALLLHLLENDTALRSLSEAAFHHAQAHHRTTIAHNLLSLPSAPLDKLKKID